MYSVEMTIFVIMCRYYSNVCNQCTNLKNNETLEQIMMMPIEFKKWWFESNFSNTFLVVIEFRVHVQIYGIYVFGVWFVKNMLMTEW